VQDATRKPDTDAENAGSRKLVAPRDDIEEWISSVALPTDRLTQDSTDRLVEDSTVWSIILRPLCRNIRPSSNRALERMSK